MRFPKASLFFLLSLLLVLVVVNISIPQDRLFRWLIQRNFPVLSKGLSFENASIRLRGGLSLDSLHLVFPVDGDSLQISLTGLDLDIRLFPLLRGRVLVDDISILSLRLEAGSFARLPGLLASQLSRQKKMIKELEAFLLSSTEVDKTLLLSGSAKDDSLQVHNLEISLQPASLQSLSVELKSRDLFLGGKKVLRSLEFSGEASQKFFKGSGHATFAEQGRLELLLDLKPKTMQKSVAQINISELPLQWLFSFLPDKKGNIEGQLFVKAESQGLPIEIFGVDMRAVATVENLVVENFPFQKKGLLRDNAPEFSRVTFSSLSLPELRLKNGRITVKNLKALGPDLKLAGHARATVDGGFRLRLKGVFSRSGMLRLPPLTRKAMTRLGEGRGSFGMTLSGNLKNQKIELDQSVLKNLVNNQLQDIGRGILKIFQ